MDIQEYIKIMKKVQYKILAFIERDEEFDAYYDKIVKSLTKIKILENDNLIYETLNLIVKISNNHFRSPYFFKRIEFLIEFFKNKIKQTYSNQEIFHVFKSNKRVLLYLITQDILKLDDYVTEQFKSDKYVRYGYYDYFLNESVQQENPEEYEKNRLNGENENYICKLIREDSVEEFVAYTNQKSISINYTIQTSLFETNNYFLKRRRTTLIEYAAFFGSIQIFNYLFINRALVSPELWYCVIHGKNPELIHFLERNKIESKNPKYEDCYKEAIKCHHNDVVDYFNNSVCCKISSKNSDVFSPTYQYFNYAYFNQNLKNKLILFYACKYDYVELVTLLVKFKDLDPNVKIMILKFQYI